MTGTTVSKLQPPQAHGRQASGEYSPQLTVFCDFDGPLVDVSSRYYSTYKQGLVDIQEIYKDTGINLPIIVLSKQQFWQMKQDRVPDVEIAMRSGLQGEQISMFLGFVRKIVNQPTLLKKDKMQPGVRWALARLHSQGIKLVLVTLRRTSEAKQILQNYGLARLFSGIYGTEEASAAYDNYAEVKTRLLQIAHAEQATRCPKSAWMVGDTEADIIAGQAVGIPTIALCCGIRSCSSLKKFQPTSIHSDLLSATNYLLGLTQLLSV